MNSDVLVASPPAAAVGSGHRPLRPRDDRQALGLLGERIAARWLRRRGWTVIAHRFRSGHRDLDLVARQGTLVAFVEVKTRRTGGYGGPLGAVQGRKQRELIRSAQGWIARHGQPEDTYRFDVVGVLLEPRADGAGEGARRRAKGGRPGRGTGHRAWIRHVENAFQLSGRA